MTPSLLLPSTPHPVPSSTSFKEMSVFARIEASACLPMLFCSKHKKDLQEFLGGDRGTYCRVYTVSTAQILKLEGASHTQAASSAALGMNKHMEQEKAVSFCVVVLCCSVSCRMEVALQMLFLCTPGPGPACVPCTTVSKSGCRHHRCRVVPRASRFVASLPPNNPR